MLVRVPGLAFFFWICFKLTNIKLNCAVTHYYFIIFFKSYLCFTGKARNASNTDICFFFFSVYWHSDLEGSVAMGLKTGVWNLLVLSGRDASRDLTFGRTIWNKFKIVLLCGLLVGNNTFLKCLTGYNDNGGYENWNVYVVVVTTTITTTTKAMKCLCWLF